MTPGGPEIGPSCFGFQQTWWPFSGIIGPFGMSTQSKSRITINAPGHAHEITFSCYRRMPLLKSIRVKEWLAESLDYNRTRFNFDLWAYVFMPEHVHLLIFPKEKEYDIDNIRAAIKSRVTKRAFAYLRVNNPRFLEKLLVPNSRSKIYRFWQDGPGFDRNVFSEKAVGDVIDYLHANPIRRRLCVVATDYAWSSASQYAGFGDRRLLADVCPVVRRSP